MKYKISPMTTAQIPEAVSIEIRANHYPISAAGITELLARPLSFGLVVDKGFLGVGYSVVLPKPDEVEILRLSIAASHYGCLSDLLVQLRESISGPPPKVSIVISENDIADYLGTALLDCGFKAVGLVKGFSIEYGRETDGIKLELV